MNYSCTRIMYIEQICEMLKNGNLLNFNNCYYYNYTLKYTPFQMSMSVLDFKDHSITNILKAKIDCSYIRSELGLNEVYIRRPYI